VVIRKTPHPKWVKDLLAFLEPYKNRVVDSRIFRDMYSGELTSKRFQGGLINFYPLIESFPLYMALNLAKVPAGESSRNRKARYWLIRNINQERIHTTWWKQWAVGFGVSEKVLEKPISPPAEMDAINNYLWRICSHSSLPEAMSAVNYAVESATGEWPRRANDSLHKYYRRQGFKVNQKTLEWVSAHASYDDKHPEQALEIIKAYATNSDEQDKVKQAAKRSLEYYALALEACYDIFR